MRRIDPKTGLRDGEYVIQVFPRDFSYKSLRKSLDPYPAKSAWWTVKVMREFFALETEGRVRLVKILDDTFDFEDTIGEMYDPEVNPGLDGGARMLKAAEKRERERANQDGIWGIRGEVLVEGKWVELDSCWGFIGDDVEEYPVAEFAKNCIDACRVEDERMAFLGFENEELCLCR